MHPVTPLVRELTQPLHRELDDCVEDGVLKPEYAITTQLTNTLHPADPHRLYTRSSDEELAAQGR
jgi:hypothetical protein